MEEIQYQCTQLCDEIKMTTGPIFERAGVFQLLKTRYISSCLLRYTDHDDKGVGIRFGRLQHV